MGGVLMKEVTCRECLQIANFSQIRCPWCGSSLFEENTEEYGQQVEYMPDGIAFRVGTKNGGGFHGKVLFKNRVEQSFIEEWNEGVFVRNQFFPPEASELQPYQKDYVALAQAGTLRAKPDDYLSVLFGIVSPDEITRWCYPELSYKSEKGAFQLNEAAENVLETITKKGQGSYDIISGLDWKAIGDGIEKAEIEDCKNFAKQILGLRQRRNNLRCSHYRLAAPVINPLYYGTDYSCLELLLGLTFSQTYKIIHRLAYVVFSETNVNQRPIVIEAKSRTELYEKLKSISWKDYVVLCGPEAIRELLKKVDVEQELILADKELSWDGRLKRIRQGLDEEIDYIRIALKLHILNYFKVNHIRPEWIVMDAIPVPPVIDERFGLPAGLLLSYVKLFNSNKRLKRLCELPTPDFIVQHEKHLLQSMYDNIIHYGCFNSSAFEDGEHRSSLVDVTYGRATERIVYKEGAIYWGTVSNGRRDGWGILVYPGCYYYIGEFKDNERTGRGKYYNADGYYFEGTFINGELQGEKVAKQEGKVNFLV